MSTIPFSFEIFPPKTEQGRAKLEVTVDTLNALGSEFFSVTYGAGGTTRDTTKGLVKKMIQGGIDTAPHLSFGGDDEDTIRNLLAEYKEAGVKRVVALRGDLPSGMGGTMQLVYAAQLVEFIRTHFGDHFHVEVAAYPEIHPEGRSYDADIGFLKRKFDAGANSAITQYFYSPDAYFYFVERCRELGIDAPIVPGIMPITNYTNLARFSANCGADIPRWLAKKLDAYGDDLDSLKAFGTDFVTSMCERLIAGGAPSLHFYTMNQIEPVKTLCNNLGLSKA